MSKKCVNPDKAGSMLYWKFRIKLSEDFRLLKPERLIIAGWSKIEGWAESSDFKSVFMDKISMLYEKGYVLNSDYGKIWKKGGDKWLNPLDRNPIICLLDAEHDIVWSDEFLKLFSRGDLNHLDWLKKHYCREKILRVVK